MHNAACERYKLISLTHSNKCIQGMTLMAAESHDQCHWISYEIEYEKTFEKTYFVIVEYFNGMKQFNNV